jgi:hypothetical protein
MALSFSSSGLDLEKWRESMKSAAPLAKAAGVEIEETAALLSVLADGAIHGSMAGTALKSVFNKIKKEGVPLQDTLEELAKKNLSLAEAERLVGERGQAALLILTNNTDKIKGLTAQYENATGAAADMAAIMDDTAEGAIARFSSAFSALQIKIGGIVSRGLLPLLEAIGPVFVSFTKWDKATQTVTVAVIALLAVLGPLLIGLGLIAGIIPKVIIALRGLAVAFRVAWAAALGPLLLVAIALTYVGLGIAKVTGNTEQMNKNFDKLSAVEKALLTIQQAFHFIKIAIASVGITVYELIYQFLDLDRQIMNALNGAKSNFAKFGNFMGDIGNKIIDGMNDAIQSFITAVVRGAEIAFNSLVSIAEKSVNKVIGAVNTISDIIPGASNIGAISLGKISLETPQFEGMDGMTTRFDETFEAAGENAGAAWARGIRDEVTDKVVEMLKEIPDGSEFLGASDEINGTSDDLEEMKKKLEAIIPKAEEAAKGAGALGKALGGAGELGRKAAQNIGFAFDALGKKAVQALAIATLAGTATAEQQAEISAIKIVQGFEKGLAGKEAGAQAAIAKVFGTDPNQFGGFGGSGGFGQDQFGDGMIQIPSAQDVDIERAKHDDKLARLRKEGLAETDLAKSIESDKTQALLQMRKMQVAGYGQSFDSILNLTEAFGGKQSGIMKGIFAVSKGFAIAESVIAIQVAVSKAMAKGFPGNIPLIASAVNQGASIISTIRGAQPSFLGGGYTGSGSRSGGVDGRGGFNAVLHPNETVTDHTKGDSAGGGGVVINMTINGDPNPSVVAQLREEISNFAMTKLANIHKRGGVRAAAVSSR